MARGLPNLDWLRVFAAAAETESFALAASRLGVTPAPWKTEDPANDPEAWS